MSPLTSRSASIPGADRLPGQPHPNRETVYFDMSFVHQARASNQLRSIRPSDSFYTAIILIIQSHIQEIAAAERYNICKCSSDDPSRHLKHILCSTSLCLIQSTPGRNRDTRPGAQFRGVQMANEADIWLIFDFAKHCRLNVEACSKKAILAIKLP